MKNYCENCGKCGLNFDTITKDSFIEEIFWKKSLRTPSDQKLLWEWIDSKSIYTSYSSLSRRDFGNYSKHDASHSVAILNAITAVIGKERMELLGATDLWLLLHCAYGHDIGMHVPQDEKQDLWAGMKEGTPFYEYFENCLLSDDEDIKNAAHIIKDVLDKLNIETTKISDPQFSLKNLDAGYIPKICRACAFLTAEYIRR